MNTTEISLEDKIKPYLILAKAFQTQITRIKKLDPILNKERLETLEHLKDLVLNQMLFQVKYDDLVINDYINLGIMLEVGCDITNLKELDSEIPTRILPLSNLIDALRINDLGETKK